jgi:DUF971 family protein
MLRLCQQRLAMFCLVVVLANIEGGSSMGLWRLWLAQTIETIVRVQLFHLAALMTLSTSQKCCMSYAILLRNIPMVDQAPTPTELRLSKDKRLLTVGFANGSRFELPAELLRVESPSAEVQGHDPSQKKIIPGKRNVEILKIEPVGNYAVRIVFDDMHDTGIYSWDVLNRLGTQGEELMANYEARLREENMSRD